METKELEERLFVLREVYFDGIDFRFEDYKQFGYTKDEDFEVWEYQLTEDLKEVRDALMQVCPEKYHFGNKTKVYMRKNGRIASRCQKQRPSKFGDNGYLICSRCGKIFKAKVSDRDRESFDHCLDHEVRKEDGVLKLNLEEFQWRT
jgi:hypothetical protein